MPIYGPDISSYQAGLDLSKLASASFAIAKCSEGTYYTDSAYQGWRRQAAGLRMPFVWYHFLTTQDAAAQVAHTKACVGDLSLPGMLDVEPTGSYRPTVQDVLDYADVAKQAGLNVRLAYLPRWYWQEIGSPSLSGLRSRGIALVSSSYPGGTGSPTRLYPGDAAAGWQAYGGLTPELYQYTNQATDGGQSLDYNAFRGDLADFLTLLGGSTMGTYTMSAGWKADYPDAAAELDKHIPVGTVIDDGDAAAYAMVRSTVTAYRAGVIEAKLDQLLARPAAPVVDVKALAAALQPLLTAGASADQIATAVVGHLATTLAKG